MEHPQSHEHAGDTHGIRGGHTAPLAVAEATIYTCPMHPEVRQDHPGVCQNCGMTLEPEMPGLDDDENAALAMILSSVTVIANALRLRQVRLA